jgi:hypothetical protein
MLTRSTFPDSNLTVLNGRYAEYPSTGYLSSDGNIIKTGKMGSGLYMMILHMQLPLTHRKVSAKPP